jgi:hypothetical protein
MDGRTDGHAETSIPPLQLHCGGYKNKTLSEQFQFQISKEKSLREAKLIPLIHKCMTDHFTKESNRWKHSS